MSIKDILVHIGNSQHSAAVLELAIGLARKHQAHLTGLHVITHRHYIPDGEADTRVEEAEAMFREKTARAGISADWRSVNWPVVGVHVSEVVNLHAYCKDLVIVGQTERGSRKGDLDHELPERVILGSGRPVLIVPYAGTFTDVGDKVMVAWKSGRESTRAVNDAMPFLQAAREVRVMAISSTDYTESADKGPCDEICTHLARHGIRAEGERFAIEEISVGDVLLNQVWEEGCNLLVMGGYARTTGGFELGPIARNILEHMTAPVLMSH